MIFPAENPPYVVRRKIKLQDEASIFGWQLAASGGGWQDIVLGRDASATRPPAQWGLTSFGMLNVSDPVCAKPTVAKPSRPYLWGYNPKPGIGTLAIRQPF